MKKIFLLFPHQLFKDIQRLKEYEYIYLIEEYLFFHQYRFHQQKLVLHRASMKYYQHYLEQHHIKVIYVEASEGKNHIAELIPKLKYDKKISLGFYDVCDDWLQARISSSCEQHEIPFICFPTPLFINTHESLDAYFASKKKYFQTDFYIQQRKLLKILLESGQKPAGGKWSFDAENRQRYPKNRTAPKVDFPKSNPFHLEANQYIKKHFPDNYGELHPEIIYPITHEESDVWLQQFFETRLEAFGQFEDAIVPDELILHHSVLTPMLNIGLLVPQQVIEKTLDYAEKYHIPLNSLEGFIRQIIGWREFIRGVYLYKGRVERTKNYWGFHRRLPDTFYTGSTGIKPVDDVIQKVLRTGYCHHIERLMILGNFMLLNEFHPDAIYQWFMEMFIDAYDWVMVPNVYGMSQFADGGIMSSKPYISGSSYVLKMSRYKKAAWCEIWDALFWTFMQRHRDFFSSNPRLGMLLGTYDKMSETKKMQFDEIVKNYRVSWM
jgi:deoxyribodipyrimidine photolyase-related protein